MSSTETTYKPQFRLPEFIERGRNQVIQCPVYLDDALAAPSSGTVSVYDPVGTAAVDAQTVTISNSIAQYTVTTTHIAATVELKEGWRVEWSLTMPDSVVHVFRNAAAVVRRRLYPVITDGDLTDLHSNLDDLLDSDRTHWGPVLDAACVRIQRRLIQAGNRPYLVMDPWALADVHRYLTLHIVFEDLAASTGVDGRYAELSDRYEDRYERSWSALSFAYDADKDGQADSTQDRRAGSPTLWTNAPNRSARFRKRWD